MMDLGEFLASEHTQAEIDSESLRLLERLMPYGRAWMLRLDRRGNPLVSAMRATHADPADSAEILWDGVQDALRQRRPVLLAERRSPGVLTARPGANRVAVVPLSTEDEVVGALYLEAHRAVGGYTPKHLRRLGWLASLLAIKAANVRLTVVRDELRTAGCMQRALLAKEPKSPPGYEACARIVPASTIGGDLYDTLELPNGRCLYAIGDVVGHGVGAALLMAGVLAAMRALALNARDPLDLMSHLREQFHRCMEETSFVTLFLGMLDPVEHRLDFVNAGHPPPAMIDPEGRVQRLDTEGLALGMDFEAPCSRGTVEMPPGSLFCAWSDGLTEARSEQHATDFADDRLLELLARLRHEPLESIVNQAFGAVDRWLEGYAAQDDRTMLLVRREVEATS
jgi:sigma-B regulation protein RsbU (phosphoserine phosphatase)